MLQISLRNGALVLLSCASLKPHQFQRFHYYSDPGHGSKEKDRIPTLNKGDAVLAHRPSRVALAPGSPAAPAAVGAEPNTGRTRLPLVYHNIVCIQIITPVTKTVTGVLDDTGDLVHSVD